MRICTACIAFLIGLSCTRYPLDTEGDLYEKESVWQYLKAYSIWQERVPKGAFEFDSPEAMLFHMYDTLKGDHYTKYDNITCGACGLSNTASGQSPAYGTVAWDSLTDSTALLAIYPEFLSDTYDSLLSAMNAMAHAHAFRNIIIDLRHNRGGDIEATDSIIEAILPSKTPYLVETYRKYDQPTRQSKTMVEDTQVTKGPQHWAFKNKRFAVLVDSLSASASEMLVAALKDGFSRNGNGDSVVIVGETTYGKAIGQICIRREYLGRQDLKITFMRMRGVTGRIGDYQGKGIAPDVVVHNRLQQEEIALKILEPSARLRKKITPLGVIDRSERFPSEAVIIAPPDDYQAR
jgi:hypothetical protein